MPVPLTLYGAPECEDTERTRTELNLRGLPFHEIHIDSDAAAEAFVTFINHGFRSTPTLVIGTGRRKIVLTEPDSSDLDWALSLFPILK